MQSSSYLTVDLTAIQKNLDHFRQESAVMVMVKANAYGTDARRIASFVEERGASFLGVAHVEEAVAIREAGITTPLLVIASPPFEAARILQYRLTPAVSSLEEIFALERAALSQKVPVHLHVNTGMHRFGVDPEEALRLVHAIQKSTHLYLEGVMTHFTSSDRRDLEEYSYKQIARFEEVVSSITPSPRWVHLANSAGALHFPLPFCNLTRIGIGLLGYGVTQKGISPLSPALKLSSHLSFIQNARKGETIGYHCAYPVTKEKMRIGIVPFGYYDGLHRHYKEKGYVLIRGREAAMVGNICMDFMMVDITDIPDAQVGDTVTLFDTKLRPETVAEWGNTDVRELLTSIGSRTKRIFE